MTTKRYAIWLIVGTMAASDTLLALCLLELGMSWWKWLVGAAVLFHAACLLIGWWSFVR